MQLNEVSFNRHPLKREVIVDTRWPILDHGISSYLTDFSKVDKRNILPDLFDSLRNNRESVVIDLMSPPTALRDLVRFSFRSAQETRKFSVGIKDSRRVYKFLDKWRGIDFISGDLNKSATWRELEERLNGKKADLIMERGYGGLQYLPVDQLYYRAVLARIWEMLKPEGGVFLAQTPPKEILEARGIKITDWLELLKARGVEYNFEPSVKGRENRRTHGYLMMKRNPQVETLPELAA